MIIQLQDDDGIFELDIPMSCHEIDLNGFHDFKVAISKLPEEIGKDIELDADIDSIIIEAIGVLVKGDLLRIDYAGEDDSLRIEEGSSTHTF